MSLDILLLLVLGLLGLVLGGEFLVRGSARLAALAGVSPLIIGLTVVSYGTSAPELAVSIRAGLAGNDSIAVANVVGSNIFNVLFILGACAALSPLVVDRRLVRIDVPVMIAVSLLAGAFSLGGRIAPWEGALLAAGALAYTVWTVRAGRGPVAADVESPPSDIPGADQREPPPWRAWPAIFITIAAAAVLAHLLDRLGSIEAACALAGALAYLGAPLLRGGGGRRAEFARQAGFILTGLAILVVGAGWLVDGAVSLARGLGVSDAIIGLTIVAAGTSLPEVAASIIATLRGERSLAIGNVVGSNIANILCILGVSSLVTPGGLSVAPEMQRLDVPLMILIAVACLPVFYSGYLIRRWEGLVFLGGYLGYTTYLVATATKHDFAPALGEALAYVFAPVALAAFAATGIHTWFLNRRT
jgi:cation:H+ antiporter